MLSEIRIGFQGRNELMGAAPLCGTNGISKHNKYLFCLVLNAQLLGQLGV
jgi:hypothetical protein